MTLNFNTALWPDVNANNPIGVILISQLNKQPTF